MIKKNYTHKYNSRLLQNQNPIRKLPPRSPHWRIQENNCSITVYNNSSRSQTRPPTLKITAYSKLTNEPKKTLSIQEAWTLYQLLQSALPIAIQISLQLNIPLPPSIPTQNIPPTQGTPPPLKLTPNTQDHIQFIPINLDKNQNLIWDIKTENLISDIETEDNNKAPGKG